MSDTLSNGDTMRALGCLEGMMKSMMAERTELNETLKGLSAEIAEIRQARAKERGYVAGIAGLVSIGVTSLGLIMRYINL